MEYMDTIYEDLFSYVGDARMHTWKREMKKQIQFEGIIQVLWKQNIPPFQQTKLKNKSVIPLHDFSTRKHFSVINEIISLFRKYIYNLNAVNSCR